MVKVHRPHPHADAGACLGDLGHCLWGEVLTVDVGLNLLDDCLWDIVFVIAEQALQELCGIIQQLLAGLPIVRHLLPCVHHGAICTQTPHAK